MDDEQNQDWLDEIMLDLITGHNFDYAAKAIRKEIAAQQKQLLERVRVEVINNNTKPSYDADEGYCIVCNFQSTDGSGDCRCLYDNELRTEQRAALDKMIGELE